MKSILIIVDYFGAWPEWFGMYLRSCEHNPTVQWQIHTDCPLPRAKPANVTFVSLSRREYLRQIRERLGISFRPRILSNICNLRPTFGMLYRKEIEGYDFFGWGDIDVIYGDIRQFYTDDVLSRNVISSSSRICTGHLTLIRNVDWLRRAFLHIRGWRRRLEDPRPTEWHECLDEARLSGILSPCADLRRRFGPRYAAPGVPHRFWSHNYFQEQWATPFTPGPWHDGNPMHPEVWYWQQGHLTNERDGKREFLYLHLMNFKARRFVDEALYGDRMTWDRLPRIMHFDSEEAGAGRVRIDRQGMHLERA